MNPNKFMIYFIKKSDSMAINFNMINTALKIEKNVLSIFLYVKFKTKRNANGNLNA